MSHNGYRKEHKTVLRIPVDVLERAKELTGTIPLELFLVHMIETGLEQVCGVDDIDPQPIASSNAGDQGESMFGPGWLIREELELK